MAGKYKPVEMDQRRMKPLAEAWDFEGRVFRYNYRYDRYTIDAGCGSRAPSKWTPAEHNSFRRFLALPVEKRKSHAKCAECKRESAAPGSKECNRCSNIRRGRTPDVCCIEGCEEPRKSDGKSASRWCHKHHQEHENEMRRDRTKPRLVDEANFDRPIPARHVSDKVPPLPYSFRAFSWKGTLSEELRK